MSIVKTSHPFLVLALAALAGLSAPAAEDAAPAPPPPAPVGWWLAAPEVGPALRNAAPGGPDGRILSPSVARAPGAPSGAALVFDGADDESVAGPGGLAAVALPAEWDLATGFSLALWARLDAPSAFSPFVSRTTDPESFGDGFCIYAADGSLGAFVGSSADDANLLSGPPAATNAWTHLCLTCDGTISSFYVGGALAASATNAAGTAATAAPLVLGTVLGTETAWPLDGAVADVRLFAAPLSAAEVAALHAQMSEGPGGDSGKAGAPAAFGQPAADGRPTSGEAALSAVPPAASAPPPSGPKRLRRSGVPRRPPRLRVATPLE